MAAKKQAEKKAAEDAKKAAASREAARKLVTATTIGLNAQIALAEASNNSHMAVQAKTLQSSLQGHLDSMGSTSWAPDLKDSRYSVRFILVYISLRTVFVLCCVGGAFGANAPLRRLGQHCHQHVGLLAPSAIELVVLCRIGLCASGWPHAPTRPASCVLRNGHNILETS